MTGKNFLLFFLCFCLSGIGAWLVGCYGHHINLLDQPNDRSSHIDVTPKGGGIGMLLAFITSALLLSMPAAFWLPTAILALVSLLGDRWHLSPVVRLLFQFAASFICLFGLWSTLAWVSVGYLLIMPLAFYVVGTTNYYNFMDGINGIAAVTGVIGFGLMAFYGGRYGTSSDYTVLAVCMVFCCLGFLPFNIPTARVFMGDVGSILLGFIYAVFVVRFSESIDSFLCLASFLFPFYADEITTQLVRLKNGEKLWTPHRRHLYQILANEYSFAHWKVSLGYGFAQLFIGVSILYFFKLGLPTVLSIFFLYFVVFSVISLCLRKRLTHKPGMY